MTMLGMGVVKGTVSPVLRFILCSTKINHSLNKATYGFKIIVFSSPEILKNCVKTFNYFGENVY